MLCSNDTYHERTLKKEFYRMHTRDLLEEFRSEVQKQLGVPIPQSPNKGDLEVAHVLTSDYFFS